MITIKETGENVVFYECSCGVKGKCLIKPLANSDMLIVNIRCPLCLSVAQVCLAADNKKTSNISWGYVVETKILGYKIVGD